MRISKKITIDDKSFIVNELTVRQIWSLFQGLSNDSGSADTDKTYPIGIIDEFLSIAVPELTRECAMDMTPSELTVIRRAFEEVNSDFLSMMKAAGLGSLLQGEVKKAVQEETGVILTEQSAT